MNDIRIQAIGTTAEKILPAIVSVVGYSGSGKTTFLVKLISNLTGRGFRVGTIKHDVHGFEMDKPGKDSWRHKKAGAATTLISSPSQIGLVMDVDHDHGPEELLPYLSLMDIVLAEGFKNGQTQKLEIFRSSIHQAPFCIKDRMLLALISDEPCGFVPRYSPEDVDGVAELLIKHFSLEPAEPAPKNKAL